MITRDDAINLLLAEEELIKIIQKARDKFKIAQLDNLRDRHPNIQFDCLLRGYVGEYAITRWLSENNIHFEATNLIVEDDFVDIDFFYKNKNIELKTSLVPDIDKTLDNAIRLRDIKLIKREEHLENLRGDLHLQIYYDQRRKLKDDWLSAQPISLSTATDLELYKALGVRKYINTTFLVAWIDKPSLINHINHLPANRRTWSFKDSKRMFWACRIRDAKRPIELITYLKNL